MHPNLLSYTADGMWHTAFAQQEETVLAAPPSPVKPAITIAVAGPLFLDSEVVAKRVLL